MKKTFLLVMLFLCGAVILACSKTTEAETTVTSNSTTSLVPIVYDYSDFSDLFISEVDLQLYMPQTDYYIYYFRYECTHCLEIKSEVLQKVASLTNDTVYFVVATSQSDVNPQIAVTKTPTLVLISNETFIEAYVGVSAIRDILDILS